MIEKILIEKRDALLASGDALVVNFTVKDINILSDSDQLRLLKLTVPFPEDYKTSKDLFSCADAILRDKELYKVLEFCIKRNRVLQEHVLKVFPKLGE